MDHPPATSVGSAALQDGEKKKKASKPDSEKKRKWEGKKTPHTHDMHEEEMKTPRVVVCLEGEKNSKANAVC